MIQRVWRIWDKTANAFVPATKNTTGTYATERGARAALTHMAKWGAARAVDEGFEQYEVVCCYLIPANEVQFEVEDEG